MIMIKAPVSIGKVSNNRVEVINIDHEYRVRDFKFKEYRRRLKMVSKKLREVKAEERPDSNSPKISR